METIMNTQQLSNSVKITNNNIRSSEKSMIASCSFADEVAKCAISSYKEHTPKHLQESLQQTVLAAFVLCDERKEKTSSSSSLQTLCFGVGTKFLSQPDQFASPENSNKVIRDLHAEVLARKALQKLLVDEIEIVLRMKKKEEDSSASFLVMDTDKDADSRISLAPHCTLHFYTSSTPCGNSAVRRWGTGSSSRAKPNNNNNSQNSENFSHSHQQQDDHHSSWFNIPHKSSLPEFQQHEQLHVVQREAGQVALLCKFASGQQHENNNGNSAFPPQGTILSTNRDQILIPCCSGKIAAWNFLQCWEGLLLKNKMNSGNSNVVPSSIVVGRKFSQTHCQRALCCRVDLSRQLLSKKEKKMNKDWVEDHQSKRRRQRNEEDTKDKEKGIIQEATTNVHHPVLLSTSVKFDESTKNVAENEKANFEEHRCLWWNKNSSEVLCGKSGKAIVKSDSEEGQCEYIESLLSTDNFLKRVKKVFREDIDTHVLVEKDELLQTLVNHPLLFQHWPRCDLLDSFL